MRLVTRKIYRAFPELDRFSDEQCRRFVKAASRGLVRKALRFAAMAILFSIVAGAVFGGFVYAYFRLDFDPTSASGNALFVLSTIGPFVLAAFSGFVAALLLGDLLLRRRIRKVVNTRGRCHNCGYILLGLRVGSDLKVTCPECAHVVEVDQSLGELASDESGATVFRPKDEQFDPAMMALLAARRKRFIRRGIACVAMIFGVPLIVVGWWLLSLHLQAARARDARVTVAKMRELIAKAYPDQVADAQGTARLAAILAEADVTNQTVMNQIRQLAPEGSYPGLEVIAQPPDSRQTDPKQLEIDRKTAELSRKAADAVVANLKQLGWMERAAEIPQIRVGPWAKDWGDDTPVSAVTSSDVRLGQCRGVMRLNIARMQLAVEQNDIEEYAAALGQSLALAREVGRGPRAIDYLVAANIEESTIRIVRRHACTPREHAWILPVSRAIDAHTPVSALQLYDCYTAGLADWIAEYFSDAKQVQQALLRIENPAATLDLADRPKNQELGSFEDNLTELKRLSEWQRVRLAHEKWERPLLDTNAKPKYAVVDQLIVSGRSVERSVDTRLLQVRGTRIMLALESYRAKHGNYPDQLADIVLFLSSSEILRDPYSGRPFGYRRIDASADPLRRGYLLWSAGHDGADNNGASDQTRSNSVALDSWKSEGLDYLINHPE